MTSSRKPMLVVENDAFTRIAGIVLDPTTPVERHDAYAAFFEHDLPDFDGWLERVRAASTGFYPAEVRLIDTQKELLENLPDADAVLIESLELGKRELDAGKRLRLVQKFGTVTRSIDLAACQARGVKIGRAHV